MLVPITMVTVWLEAPLWFGCLLLFIAPFAVCWLVWTVLHDTEGPRVELPPEHEWDYLDRPDLAQR